LNPHYLIKVEFLTDTEYCAVAGYLACISEACLYPRSQARYSRGR